MFLLGLVMCDVLINIHQSWERLFNEYVVNVEYRNEDFAFMFSMMLLTHFPVVGWGHLV